MSRTTLTILTAAGLVLLSGAVLAARISILGDDAKVPIGPHTWKVAMVVQGKTTDPKAQVLTATPLDFAKQHIVRDAGHSAELLDKPPDLRHPNRRQVLWVKRSGVPDGPFRASYEFYCMVDVRNPTGSMTTLARTLYEGPSPEDHLGTESGNSADGERLSALARQLTAGLEHAADQAEALYHYVERQVKTEPSTGAVYTAADCFKNGSGDSGAKARLLAALLRNRGIAARIVTGLTLAKGPEQLAHYWVEAWVHGRWVPMCPIYSHYGKVPPTYLVFGFGDQPIVRGRHVQDLDYAFLVERTAAEEVAGVIEANPGRRLLLALSFQALPPAERRLVEFLLLLPIAALMICVYRNIIGVGSFGTYAPALVGLAFRDLHSLPGMLIFVSIILVGWLMRRVLDRFHLLQVPRTAVMLTLVVILLILTIVGANYQNPPVAATQYVSLFPMVILTGMIERFWTLENEDATATSFKTLFGTMAIAASIGLVLSLHAVVHHMIRYPETLGFIMAGQLLVGRYTGYKLSELFRFRDFVRSEPRLMGELPT